MAQVRSAQRTAYDEDTISEATGYAETEDPRRSSTRALASRETMAEHKAETGAEAEKVRAAGGLYIIGTERHESRRIDNQLRGRSRPSGRPRRDAGSILALDGRRHASVTAPSGIIERV